MNQAYTEIKEELKTLGKEIGEKKLQRKELCRKGKSTYDIDFKITRMKFYFRHKHIARCLLKGLTYEEIENPHKDNKPDWRQIEHYKTTYEKLYAKYTKEQFTELNTQQTLSEAICVV